jgi:hypothetical protein
MEKPFETVLRPIGRLFGQTSFEEGVAYRRDYRGRNFYVKVIKRSVLFSASILTNSSNRTYARRLLYQTVLGWKN